MTIDKNLLSDEKLGNLELQTNFKTHNYDTNKLTNFLVNDFNYRSNDNLLNSFISTKILANVKNINYESKNVDIYKNDPTNEIFLDLWVLSEVNLEKLKDNSKHFLKPKFLMRFSPGSMRKGSEGTRLNPSNAFS